MLGKIEGIARALAILLAIAMAVLPLPVDAFDYLTVLIVLGAISGMTASGQRLVNLAVAAVALPVVANALANLPTPVGEKLAAVFENLGLTVAGAVAMGVAVTIVTLVRDGYLGLAGGASSSES